MLRPRFEALSLRYGIQDGEWTFPERDRPVIVAGPNGSGKTTLVTGLFRTLFGFDRRRPDDASELDLRKPWDGEAMHGHVVLVDDEERFEIEREFATDRVRVRDTGRDVEHFEGDGNPAARNQEATHYREILTGLLGLRDLDSYSQTLLIGQGALPETSLGEHLLRIAAGGHARVEAARRRIAEAHREITRRPLHSAASAAINPRELETVQDEMDRVRGKLEEARAASERRAPLALDRERTAARLEALDRQIELLESALSMLARTDATELSSRHLREHIRRLGEVAEELGTAADRLELAERQQHDAIRGGEYPANFAERLARAELRWRDIEEFRRPPVRSLGVGSAVILLLAAGLVALGYPLWAAVAGGVGGVGVITWLALRIWTWGRLRAAESELDRLFEGVAGETPTAKTADRALARFRTQRETTSRVRRARDDLADAMREARAALAAFDPTGGEVESGQATGVARHRSLLTRLNAAAEAAREQLAGRRMEMDRIGDLSLALPDDVAPTEEGVNEALRRRREERGRVQESLQEVSQALIERGSAAESVEALERQLASLETRCDALERKAKVLEAAHELLVDAYDDFRDRDQDRLASRISGHVARLGGDRIQGVRVDDMLEEARVRTRGRLVPMSTPPLSFGEFHAVQLGVRLGAADFLAGVGVLPPLVIDEPFAHLDSVRAQAVWRLLVEVAADRQVIITTQDAALLGSLDIEPDIAF